MARQPNRSIAKRTKRVPKMFRRGTKRRVSAQTGLAGEYHVLAQLAERGYVGALTLGHTKGVDILVTNPRSGDMRQIEVKTSRRKLTRHLIFGPKPFHVWIMNAKHETKSDPSLVYCFVRLGALGETPKFFLVPSKVVAKYVRWQHRHWLKVKRGKTSDMRAFRISEHDPDGYCDNWTLLG